MHALTLLVITLFFGRWAALIPMATLAAILVVVSYHMSEWRTFAAELRSAPKSDVIVLLLTFGLTVLIDLTVAVQVGLVGAAFLFMKRMSEVANVSAISREFGEETRGDTPLYTQGRKVPPGVQIYAIDGPFFFGAAEKFKETLTQVAGKPRVVVLLMRNVSAIDSTGLRALQEVVKRFRAGGTEVVLAGVHAQPMVAIARAGIVDLLGEDNLVGTIDEALERANRLTGARAAARLTPAALPPISDAATFPL